MWKLSILITIFNLVSHQCRMPATSHWFVFISRQNAPNWSFVSRESSHHQMITYSKNIPVYLVLTCCISIKDNKKQNMYFFAAAQANIANWFPWHSFPPKAPPSRLVLHVILCCWSPSASMMSLWEGKIVLSLNLRIIDLVIFWCYS